MAVLHSEIQNLVSFKNVLSDGLKAVNATSALLALHWLAGLSN
jgi:hypothetical protein